MNVLMNWYASCRQAIEKMKMEKLDARYFEKNNERRSGALQLICELSRNCSAHQAAKRVANNNSNGARSIGRKSVIVP